jgi:EAL domain-containing protein (putative c-di-GMP-specific phosphodiesterase class I)/CheY-like chemotaxis protein
MIKGNHMDAGKLTILVLEDDDFQRKMLVKMLNSLGVINIYEACNGVQALAILNSEDSKVIDMAICDINMPEMDGMEFMRHLGAQRCTASIVLLSTLDAALLASIAKMSLAYGINLLEVIEKPIALVQLQKIITHFSTPKKTPLKTLPQLPNFSLDEIISGVRAYEFEPYFQPKVDLKTGKIIGAEALARWIHPEHGVIAPFAFIGLLEQHNKLDELTFIMIEKSVSASQLLKEKGLNITISVNLSLTSLTDVNLADNITKVVRNAGVDASNIIFEVTESAAMTDVAHALENLARLRMNGFGLSIDDYGTGYASMQQLTRIAFTELKIDQSFIKDIIETPAMRIIVESSIEIARKLHYKSVAEGVETKGDWDLLKNMGCDIAQGYYIAKPMNLNAFLEFCDNYKVV